MNDSRFIRIRRACQHNLKNISVDIPRDRFVVITGLSGSGKSSLAFDTIYAEGRRRYVETLSTYARQFLEQMQKPEVEHIDGLPPTVAIEQRTGLSSPRSTVATTTEIYDYLRLLFARIGEPHCWKCGRRIDRQDPSQIVDAVLTLPGDTRILVLAPVVHNQRGPHKELFKRIQREGFVRVRVDDALYELRDLPELNARRKHTVEIVVDRLVVKESIRPRLAESIELALLLGNERVLVAIQHARGRWKDQPYSTRYACPRHPEVALPELTPALFSFNSPQGACPVCNGLGHIPEFDPELVVPDASLPLSAGAIDAWHHAGRRLNQYYGKLLDEFCLHFHVSPDMPFKDLPVTQRDILLHGTTPETAAEFGYSFEGVLPNLKRRWKTTDSESVKHRLHRYLSEHPCEACGGTRLQPAALSVHVQGKSIDVLCRMSIREAEQFFHSLQPAGEQARVAGPIVREIAERLHFMNEVGVEYLSLNRASATLSGGEAQRIRLATQVGSGMVGVCYVLDEPTVGLHPRDTHRLIASLRRLTEAGNTILVVEHDEETIRMADHLIELGPGAGAAGGRIVAEGPVERVLAEAATPTARYLRREESIPLPKKRRKLAPESHSIEIKGAAEHNLKSIDVCIPLGAFVCVTGVSGSGKSTLVNEVFLKALRRRLTHARERPGLHDRIVGASRIDKVIEINQSPIGRTPRSNPCTYTGAFDLIRQLFAKTREARLRGYSASRFSFNVKGGRCESCLGQGTKRIEMHFLPDVYVECDVCKGTRYNRETLEVHYRGKSIADILAMRIEEAIVFFDSIDNIRQILLALDDVGLSYMTLGQASTTLSGGEAQRVKLAAELARKPVGHTLYILDEPTTGLHLADVHNMLRVLSRLVDKGHTVLVIEHNLEVIKTADWIIDLGPEGGDGGGQIVAAGRPEEIAAHEYSHTGRFLKNHLKPAPANVPVKGGR